MDQMLFSFSMAEMLSDRDGLSSWMGNISPIRENCLRSLHRKKEIYGREFAQICTDPYKSARIRD